MAEPMLEDALNALAECFRLTGDDITREFVGEPADHACEAVGMLAERLEDTQEDARRARSETARYRQGLAELVGLWTQPGGTSREPQLAERALRVIGSTPVPDALEGPAGKVPATTPLEHQLRVQAAVSRRDESVTAPSTPYTANLLERAADRIAELEPFLQRFIDLGFKAPNTNGLAALHDEATALLPPPRRT